MRWSARTCAPRLLHVIVEERAAFLQRDAPLARRTDLDGAACNSFWQVAALRFVDPSFNPELLASVDDSSNDIFAEARLSPAHVGYPAEKMQFVSLVMLLLVTFAKFAHFGVIVARAAVLSTRCTYYAHASRV